MAWQMTGITIMSLNKLATLALFLPLAWTSESAYCAEVCPVERGHFLRFVDVFDGPPEALIYLQAEQTSPTTGYWDLGYIFDAGRIVTIRCKYDDRYMIDMKLTKRVAQCSFKADKKQHLSLTCK
ncbi:STY0301 family protein [Massilia sp. TS11]|uniref:STY0301 family protein n=1 Tax=Massilia sp. TS11 TaxID=2908003 RepID=UPI0035A36B76